MTLFNDLYNRPYLTILSEAKADGSIMKVLVPFTQVDEKNANGRIYTKDIMEREVNRVSKDIADGRFLGSSDHPKSGNTELNSVSHIVKKMWLEKDGRGWASLSILDTTAGKNLKTIIKAGGKLGVSTRGFGTFSKETSKVNSDYRLAGLDIVANPSYKAGTFSQTNIFESADLNLVEKNDLNKFSSAAHSKEGYMRKSKLMEELNEDSQWSRVVKMLFENEEDFDGTLEKYVEKNGLTIKAVLAVENGDYPDYEMAMLKLSGDEQDVANGRKMDRTPDRPAEPKDFIDESRITGVHPEKRAETVNKYRDKPGITEARINMRQRVVLSNPSFSQKQIEEMTDKNLAAEKGICESSKPPKPKEALSESEKVKETYEKRKQKAQEIMKGLAHQGAIAGFTNEQMRVAATRQLTRLGLEEFLT